MARIAVIFDFDDTLAPDSTSTFLESVGIDVPDFWRRHRARLLDGWDPMPAYLQMMIEESGQREEKITQEQLRAWGAQVSFYQSAPSIFGRIRKQVEAVDVDISVEFYLISSGIREILAATKISKQFRDIWACDFAYDAHGAITALKSVVSFTDKTRFLFQISKGIVGDESRQDPFAVNRKVLDEELCVPLDQMIIIGDGYTDIPCFSLIQKAGGVAIGVYDRESRERWGKAWGFIEDRRVAHLVAADYRKHSGLDDAVSLAIENMSKKIKLRSLTYQG